MSLPSWLILKGQPTYTSVACKNVVHRDTKILLFEVPSQDSDNRKDRISAATGHPNCCTQIAGRKVTLGPQSNKNAGSKILETFTGISMMCINGPFGDSCMQLKS